MRAGAERKRKMTQFQVVLLRAYWKIIAIFKWEELTKNKKKYFIKCVFKGFNDISIMMMKKKQNYQIHKNFADNFIKPLNLIFYSKSFLIIHFFDVTKVRFTNIFYYYLEN